MSVGSAAGARMVAQRRPADADLALRQLARQPRDRGRRLGGLGVAQQLGEPLDLAAARRRGAHGGPGVDELAQQHAAMVPPFPAVPRSSTRSGGRPPDGATELVLVRHGASAVAIPGRPFPVVGGQGDPPLAPAGRDQARRVASGSPASR